jgi:hypothetical protein
MAWADELSPAGAASHRLFEKRGKRLARAPNRLLKTLDRAAPVPVYNPRL